MTAWEKDELAWTELGNGIIRQLAEDIRAYVG